MNKIYLIITFTCFVFVSKAQMISEHNGIYTLGKLDLPLSANTYAKPFVKGGAVRVTWKMLEPTEGNFDWSFLNTEIQTAEDAEKKISIFVKTDYHGTPDWVYQSGAQKYFYIDENQFHSTFGDTLYFPFPWDGVYIQKWTNFIEALGSEFGSDTTISYVRGATESVTNGWGLPILDSDGNDWGHYNYTSDTLINTMKLVLDSFMDAFPLVPHWLEVGPIKFEKSITGREKLYVAKEIVSYSLSSYPDKTGIWREDLQCNVTSSPGPNNHWVILQDNPCRTGAQMLANVTHTTGLNRMRKCDPTMNSQQTMEAAIQKAIEYEMPYVEIYKVDILNASLDGVLLDGADDLGNICGALPVELLSFEANAENSKVLLDWQTATEINNDYFVLERSVDGRNFTFLDKINGAGNSNGIRSYKYIDEKPHSGISYYRLKQVDFDGSKTFSEIKAVNIRKDIEVNAYPNPFNDNLNFEIYAEADGEVLVEVYNLFGSLVKTKKMVLGKGNNTLRANFSELVQGAYIIKLSNGSVFQEHFKIIKK